MDICQHEFWLYLYLLVSARALKSLLESVLLLLLISFFVFLFFLPTFLSGNCVYCPSFPFVLGSSVWLFFQIIDLFSEWLGIMQFND